MVGAKSPLRSKSPLGTSSCPTKGSRANTVRKAEFKFLQVIPSSHRSHPAGDFVSCAWTRRASRCGGHCEPGVPVSNPRQGMDTAMES